jgi:hypothetical protein
MRFKDSNNNQIHELVLLPCKMGAIATKAVAERDPGVRSRGLPRTFAQHDNDPSEFILDADFSYESVARIKPLLGAYRRKGCRTNFRNRT